MDLKKQPEILYIGDPMCSWCWGFVPVLDEILSHCGDKTDFRIVVGGLRPRSAAELVDERMKSFLREHWEHVHEASNQPFDFHFFGREGFLYDTEPACRAVVTMRTLVPKKEYALFVRLQKAFYQENVDITDCENYGPLLRELEVEPGSFLDFFHSDRMKETTEADFLFTQKLGITGFPSVLLKRGENYSPLTVGYRPFDSLKPSLDSFLEKPQLPFRR